MSLKQNMLVYFIGKIFPALSVLLVMYLGVKYLGEDGFGRYNLIYNTITVLISLLIGWIQQSMLRFNSHNDFSKEDSNKNILRLTIRF
jgi:O-antigen/teichoic acid export membrane protein